MSANNNVGPGAIATTAAKLSSISKSLLTIFVHISKSIGASRKQRYVIARAVPTLHTRRPAFNAPVITSDAEDVASPGTSLSGSEVGLLSLSLSLPVGLGPTLAGAVVGSFTPLALVGSACDGSVIPLAVEGSLLDTDDGSFPPLALVGPVSDPGVGSVCIPLAVVGSPACRDGSAHTTH